LALHLCAEKAVTHEVMQQKDGQEQKLSLVPCSTQHRGKFQLAAPLSLMANQLQHKNWEIQFDVNQFKTTLLPLHSHLPFFPIKQLTVATIVGAYLLPALQYTINHGNV